MHSFWTFRMALFQVIVFEALYVRVFTLERYIQQEFYYIPDYDNRRSAEHSLKRLEKVKSRITCGTFCNQNKECTSFLYDKERHICILQSGTLASFEDANLEGEDGVKLFMKRQLVEKQCKYSCNIDMTSESANSRSYSVRQLL